MTDSGEGQGGSVLPPRAAYLKGLRAGPSTAALVLISSFVGYGALAHESGLDLLQTLVAALFVWALPGQVVLVTEIGAGAGMFAAALAVTLTAVRLLPLTVVLMPVLRGEGTPKWHQLLMSHFVAITLWTESMRRLPRMPRPERVPFYWGFATFLVCGTMLSGAAGYLLTGKLGPTAAAVLLFLTPIYFLVSMHRASAAPADRLALLFGVVLGPLVYLWLPGWELILSGLVGGTAAYVIARARRGG